MSKMLSRLRVPMSKIFSRLRGWWAVIVVVALVVVLGFVVAGFVKKDKQPACHDFVTAHNAKDKAHNAKDKKNDLILITFGLSRESLTRTRSIELPKPEKNAGSERQVSAALRGDLTRGGNAYEAEFPASQVTIGAEFHTESNSAELRVVVDPFTVERVAEGCYTGAIIVNSTGASPQAVTLAVDLTDREKGNAGLAFVLLFFGAVMGLTVKWLTDTLTPLAQRRRRFDRLRGLLDRLGAKNGNLLPSDIQAVLDDIDNTNDEQELTEFISEFDALNVDQADISKIAGIMRRINATIAQHVEIADRLGSNVLADEIRTVARAEADKLSDLRSAPWPTGDKPVDSFLTAARILRSNVDLVSWFIELRRNHPDDPALRNAYNLLRQGGFGRARPIIEGYPSQEGGAVPAERPSEADTDKAKRKGAGEGSADDVPAKPVRRFVYQHARTFAAAGSILIVTFVGFSVQYLNNASFTDDLDDWLGLFLWSAVVELSGVSVLDVVARLSTGARPVSK